MVDIDVILGKVDNIKRCMKRIKDVTNFNPDSLLNIDKQDIFILNLQRAIEATIDIATHIVASEGLGIATTVRDNFELLKDAEVINERLMKKMQAMVAFRNISIHAYTLVDIDILKSILKNNLKDIDEFYTVILGRFFPG